MINAGGDRDQRKSDDGGTADIAQKLGRFGFLRPLEPVVPDAFPDDSDRHQRAEENPDGEQGLEQFFRNKNGLDRCLGSFDGHLHGPLGLRDGSEGDGLVEPQGKICGKAVDSYFKAQVKTDVEAARKHAACPK